MKKLLSSFTGLTLLLLAGCGTANGAPVSSTQKSTNISSQSAVLKAQEVDLTVLPGAHLGPDGMKHDTFSLSDITVAQGVLVKLNVYNYDSGTHTVSNSDLGLNLQVRYDAPRLYDGYDACTLI